MHRKSFIYNSSMIALSMSVLGNLTGTVLLFVGNDPTTTARPGPAPSPWCTDTY